MKMKPLMYILLAFYIHFITVVVQVALDYVLCI